MVASQSETRPVERILTDVADETGVAPETMEPPLADVVDPDALTRLLEHASTTENGSLEVRFTYRGQEVVVGSNGDVDVR